MHHSMHLVLTALLLTAAPAYGQHIPPEVIAAGIQELGGLVSMHIENASGPGPSRTTNRVKSVNLSGNLTGNRISDGDLQLVGTLTSATHLHLNWTPTTDIGVNHLRRLSNLKYLSLQDTQITDAGLMALANMHKMESLFLNETQISSAGLKHLPRMTNLRDLYVSETNVRGLEPLAQFPRLEKLSLAGTHVGDNDLQHLANLPNLEWLFLDDTYITNEGLVHLVRFKKLTILTIRKTWVTTEGADVLRQVLPNCRIKHSQRTR